MQITLQQKKDRENAINEQKKANEDAANAYKKYVSEIISEAKRISEAFKNTINLKLRIGFFDDISEQFKKSASFLSNFNSGNFLFTIVPKIEIEFPPEDAKGPATEFGAMFYSELKSYFDNSVPIDFSLLKALQPKLKTDAEQLGEDTAKALNEGFKNISISGFEGIGEAIGTALAGGDVQSAFQAFANVLADGVTAIGKQLIAIGVAAALANEALTKLFAGPGGAALAIGAGVALIAAGAALRSALSGGIKGFAQGGLITGPQLSLLGEGPGTSRSNPEVVAPLDKLKAMLTGLGGGGMQSVVVTGRLRGNDMLLQNARTSRSQRRTTGR